MSYSDTRAMPIQYRKWFINRFIDQNKSEEKRRKDSGAYPNRSGQRDVPVRESMENIHRETFKKFK